jgi:hypothetical protein
VIVIYKCIEAMLGISPYSYHFVFLIISYVFSLTKSEKRVEQVLPGSGEEVAQTMYTHISKCKNDKIKEKKNNK